MLTKMQHSILIIAAIIVFFLAFNAMYTFSSKLDLVNIEQNIIDILEEVDSIEDIMGMDLYNEIFEAHDAFNILPTTEVLMVLRDQENNIISKERMDPYILMGLSKEDMVSMFPAYNLVEYSQESIVFEGNMYIKPEEMTYYLGLDDGEIGIVLGNDNFQRIGIKSSEFSTLYKFGTPRSTFIKL